MKKSFIYSMAALLVAGAAFTACSSSENDIENGQPEQPEAKKYTLTVEAGKGEYVAPAGTRATLDFVGDDLQASWEQYEDMVKAYVDNGNGGLVEVAELHAQYPGTSTILSGYAYESPSVGTPIILKYNEHKAFNGMEQDGTLDWIAANYKAEATVNVTGYNGANIRTSKARFVAQHAVVKFMLKDGKGNPIKDPGIFSVTVKDDLIYYVTGTGHFDDGVFYMAIPGFTGDALLRCAENKYTKTVEGTSLVNGQYYEITVNFPQFY